MYIDGVTQACCESVHMMYGTGFWPNCRGRKPASYLITDMATPETASIGRPGPGRRLNATLALQIDRLTEVVDNDHQPAEEVLQRAAAPDSKRRPPIEHPSVVEAEGEEEDRSRGQHNGDLGAVMHLDEHGEGVSDKSSKQRMNTKSQRAQRRTVRG